MFGIFRNVTFFISPSLSVHCSLACHGGFGAYAEVATNRRGQQSTPWLSLNQKAGCNLATAAVLPDSASGI